METVKATIADWAHFVWGIAGDMADNLFGLLILAVVLCTLFMWASESPSTSFWVTVWGAIIWWAVA